MSDLIKSVIHAADHLRATQETYHDTAVGLQQSIAAYQRQMDEIGDEMESIKAILREGFRLPPAQHNG